MPVATADVASTAFGLNPFGIHFGGSNPGGHAFDGHPGWDVELRLNAPIRAAADGTVQSVFSDAFTPTRFTVQLMHRDASGTYRTVYTNVEGVPPGIAANAVVSRGQVLGTAGAQTLTQGGRTTSYAMTHFQVDDFSRNQGSTNPNAVNPETFLDAAGRDGFEAIWRTAAYNAEITEPFTGNDRDVPFPLTRTWTRESGGQASRIDVTRRDGASNVFTYALFDGAGAVVERGTLTFEGVASGLSTFDLRSEGGSTRQGVADIVGDTMRLDLAAPGAARPLNLAAASVYRTR